MFNQRELLIKSSIVECEKVTQLQLLKSTDADSFRDCFNLVNVQKSTFKFFFALALSILIKSHNKLFDQILLDMQQENDIKLFQSGIQEHSNSTIMFSPISNFPFTQWSKCRYAGSRRNLTIFKSAYITESLCHFDGVVN